MKKILITGGNSYIGKSFEKWLLQYPDKYSIDFISLRDDHWKEKSFFGYDVIFHTAAIVHVKENDISKYYKINRDKTIELAKKAKKEGIKQFIFLSTMGVYGTETGYITNNTEPSPKTPYAHSKYEAEQFLLKFNSNEFNIAILRPPIVYGKGCPGNYNRLAKMASIIPIFPDIDNKRSMIYIDNLSEFIKIIIDNNQEGIYYPQNKDYVNTTNLVRLIAKARGKDIKTSKILNWIIAIGLEKSGTLRKVFGSFLYDKAISGSNGTNINLEKLNYEVVTFEESIIRIEGREQIK